MIIKRLSNAFFPELERSLVYQVETSHLKEGVFYLALDPALETINAYCLDKDGEPNPVDYSTLLLRTLASSTLHKDGQLVIKGKQEAYQAMRDWLGNDYELIVKEAQWDVGELKYDSTLQEIEASDLSSLASLYSPDPYAGVDATVVSRGEEDGAGGIMGNSPLGDTPPVDEEPAAAPDEETPGGN